jgi:hypothetical protein
VLRTLPAAEAEALAFLNGSPREREAIGDLLAVITDMGERGVLSGTPPFRQVTPHVEVATVRYTQAHVMSVIARLTDGKNALIVLTKVCKAINGPAENAAIEDALMRLRNEGLIP